MEWRQHPGRIPGGGIDHQIWPETGRAHRPLARPSQLTIESLNRRLRHEQQRCLVGKADGAAAAATVSSAAAIPAAAAASARNVRRAAFSPDPLPRSGATHQPARHADSLLEPVRYRRASDSPAVALLATQAQWLLVRIPSHGLDAPTRRHAGVWRAAVGHGGLVVGRCCTVLARLVAAALRD
eukprot:scaffold5872_cov104-Isochrysis_galbana.AAC.7